MAKSTPHSNEVIIERITGLSQLIEVYSKTNQRELQQISQHLDNVHGKIADLDTKVGIQNGRIGRLEEDRGQHRESIDKLLHAQSICPGTRITDEIHRYQDDMKPIYVVATNWKVMLLTVVSISVLISLMPGAVMWLWDKLSGILNIFSIDF